MPPLERKSIESFMQPDGQRTGVFARVGDKIFYNKRGQASAVLQELNDKGIKGDVEHWGTFGVLPGHPPFISIGDNAPEGAGEERRNACNKSVVIWEEMAGPDIKFSLPLIATPPSRRRIS